MEKPRNESDPARRTNPRRRAAAARAVMLDRIDRAISTGAWPPGHQLPTERALEAELGVTRATLRSGLKRLEAAGKIVRHVGRGTFVAAPLEAGRVEPLMQRVLGASPTEVMEVRLVLEPWAARLAATRATAADLQQMRDCIARASMAPDVPTFEQWDSELHKAIVEAAKNGLLSSLYEAIDVVRRQGEWMKLKLRTVTVERREAYQRQHGEIVDALVERDADRAAALARQHLAGVRRAILGD
jgi:DNA-binding FadR family transcriptional regulator